MDKEQISSRVRQLESISTRLADIGHVQIRHPLSQDLWRQETALAKQWNLLVSELKGAGVEGYELKPVTEEEPQELTWIQELFVTSGLDIRDLTRKDETPHSMFGDGWDF